MDQAAFNFDDEPEPDEQECAWEEYDGQDENLERVSSRIARAILDFCASHKRFHADELREYVVRVTGIAAPASADRVLRDLRQKGKVRYRVVSRRDSLYEMVDEEEPPNFEPSELE